MERKKNLTSEGFMPVYKELADIIGIENTYAIYKNMRGLQITLPKKLYTTDYILNELAKGYNEEELRRTALEYGYTEKYLRQLLKQLNNSVNSCDLNSEGK